MTRNKNKLKKIIYINERHNIFAVSTDFCHISRRLRVSFSFTRSYSVVTLNESKNKIKYLQCVHTNRDHPNKIEISQSQVEI